jgi:hypothetical protein
MALINCPECGKEISDKALSCPQCGCPISSNNGNNNIKPTPLKAKKEDDDKVIIVNKGSNYGIGCVILFVLAIIPLFFIVYDIYQQPAEKMYEPSKCDFVSSRQMWRDLKSNAISAQATYKGMWFEISGTLGEMDSDGNYFYLEDEHFLSTDRIKCVISYKKKNLLASKLMSKKRGYAIRVKGQVTDVGEKMGYEVLVTDIH